LLVRRIFRRVMKTGDRINERGSRMKAAVFYDVEDIRLETIDDPMPGDDDAIVEVAACGICGSDLEYYFGRSPVGTANGKGPLVLGHEFSGKVVALGRNVTGLRLGDRVAVNPIQSAAGNDYVRAGFPNFDLHEVLGVTTNGAFTKFVRTKAEHAYKLPEEISDEQGAFVEMLAAGVNAVERTNIQLGDLCVIYGPGPVGLSLVQLARRAGARVAMVGTRDYRLELAREMGAEFVFNTKDSASPYFAADLVEAVNEVNGGRLAERAIVATSVVSACQQALEITGNRSTVCYMGLAGPDDTVTVPLLRSLVQDKTITFSWLYPNQWPKTIRLLSTGVVDTSKIITHVGALDGITDAIRRVASRDDGVIKYMVKP
jgi:threonine dehydrogenase-like Zn-dependent dehydrogenase